MGLLLVIALIFTTGNFVEVSATDKTICDVVPENTTCTQYSCDQPPCSLQCIQSYDRCFQNCNETTCNTLACSSSVFCQQNCPNGYCIKYLCFKSKDNILKGNVKDVSISEVHLKLTADLKLQINAS